MMSLGIFNFCHGVLLLISHFSASLAIYTGRNQAPIVPLDPQVRDIDYISRHWGQLSPYHSNIASHFGVRKVGLPDGCQIEQVHLLQRHAERFPHPGDPTDGQLLADFTGKVSAATEAGHYFTGPLKFLNSWRNTLGGEYLTSVGAISEVASGIQFWNDYGRILYNATDGQLGYPPHDVKKQPLLRGTSQSRMHNSLINWALGFFGPSYQPRPQFPANWTHAFRNLIIPEGSTGSLNNTLAAHHSCNNSGVDGIGNLGDMQLLRYISNYLPKASHRLSKYTPEHFKMSTNDAYAMQLLCAYEMAFIEHSEFCSLFTRLEWQVLENSLDLQFFYNHAFGNPTARAQGIGYVEELLARLQDKYIKHSESSVNSTLANNSQTFPLGMKFYADFTHDKMILATLTALSLDYFRDLHNLETYPPRKERVFKLSEIVPFTARLVTEVIGCDSANPRAVTHERVRYYASQYGYDTDTKSAKYRFVRMRLNGGILPLSSIRGGKCNDRKDELCSLEDFIESQKDAQKRAQYAVACFGRYGVPNGAGDVDGTVPK